jgi:hypothetical protein
MGDSYPPGPLEGKNSDWGQMLVAPARTPRCGPGKNNGGNGLTQEGDGHTPGLLVAWA